MAKAILLAEDSPDDELLFKRVLFQNQVQNPIAVVRDGAEAIAYLEGVEPFGDRAQHPWPEIFFLDLKMPRVDGFAVLAWLKQHPDVKKNLLVIVLTQFGNADQIRRAYDLGANSFLPKPLSQEDLVNLIKHFEGYWSHSKTPPGDKQSDA